jgi:hypothetical protein
MLYHCSAQTRAPKIYSIHTKYVSCPVHIIMFNIEREPVSSYKQEVLGRTNRLLSLIWHGRYWKRLIQQFFYCFFCICYAVTFLPSRCLSTIGGFLPNRCLSTIRGFLPSRCLATLGGIHRYTHTATWYYKSTVFVFFKISKVGQLNESFESDYVTCHLYTLLNTRLPWWLILILWSLESSIFNILTSYRLRGIGVRFPAGEEIVSSPQPPDCLWTRPSLLSNGYRG